MTRQKKPSPVTSLKQDPAATGKTLTIIRHAKSSWKFAGLDDMDRPLSARGVRDAALMGMVLSQRGFAPALVTSSPAVRALRTAVAVTAAIGYPDTAIVLNHHIYHAGVDGLLNLVHTFDDALNWVALVGHNPGLTELSGQLTSDGPDNVPTAGVVELRFDVSKWQDIHRKQVIEVYFDKPKNHR